MATRNPSKTKAGPPRVGREKELSLLRNCLGSGRHVLLEGPVGSGKTFLAENYAKESGRKLIRVDGDARFSESKLAGSYDPALTLKRGYIKEAFREGPLPQAMREGAILLLNELNRFPEGAQNLLLPALDEGILGIPGLSPVRAHPGFRVIATQNPSEFVATSPLSEALLDRFERIPIDYPPEEEEAEILRSHFETNSVEARKSAETLARMIRLTRSHASIRRGASLRAGIAAGRIAIHALECGNARNLDQALRASLVPAFSGRMEFESDFSSTGGVEELLLSLFEDALSGRSPDLKKKP